MRPYLLASILYILLAEAGIFAVFEFLLPEYYSPLHFFIPPFLFVIFGLAHWQLTKALRRDPKRFITLFMGVTGAKMLFSLFLVLILAMVLKEAVKPVAVSFIATYLPFMALEVVFILKALKSSEEAS